MSTPTGQNLNFYIVDISAAGDSVIIPALSGGVFVRRIVLSMASATTLQFKAGTRLLSGPMLLDAYTLGYSDQPYYALEPTEPLIITLGGAVQTGGTIWYQRGPL